MSQLIMTLTDLPNVRIQIVFSSHTDLYWQNRLVGITLHLSLQIHETVSRKMFTNSRNKAYTEPVCFL